MSDPEARDIYEAINRGREKIAQRNAELERQEREKQERYHHEFRILQEKLRLALPELIRPYMRDLVKPDAHLHGPPDGNTWTLVIDVPCVAPLRAYVKLERTADGSNHWVQCSSGEKMFVTLYTVPSLDASYYDVSWSYRWGEGYNDLEEALARGAELFHEYERALQQVEERRQAEKVQSLQPVYQDAETVSGVGTPDLLKNFLRDLVREVVEETQSA